MSRPQTPQHKTIDLGSESATVPVSAQPFVSSESIIIPQTSYQSGTISTAVPAQDSTPAVPSSSYVSSALPRFAHPQISTSISANFTPFTSAAPLPLSLAGPSRQTRRGKSHVASACINCKRAHLSCDVERPCRRCLDTGKEDSCHDVQHKKRGRPRLREEQETTSASSSSQQTIVFEQQASDRPIANPRHRRTDSYRSHQSRGSESSSYGQITPIGRSMPSMPVMQSPVSAAAGPPPLCILNLDLFVLRVNTSFRRMFGTSDSIVGSHIEEAVSIVNIRETFPSIRNHIRRERERREPSYLPPILEQGHNPLQAVQDDELLHQLQGSPVTEHDWIPRRARGGHAPIHVNLWLVKASFYFVAVTVSMLSPPQHTVQTPMQLQSAAPTMATPDPSLLAQIPRPFPQQPLREVYQMPFNSAPIYTGPPFQPLAHPYPVNIPQSGMLAQHASQIYIDTTSAGLLHPPASQMIPTGILQPPYATIPPTSFMPQLSPAIPGALPPQGLAGPSSLEPRADIKIQQEDDRSGSEAPAAKRRRKIDIDDVVE